MRTSFEMEDKYIKMIRGDTLSFGLEISGISQENIDIKFGAKKDKKDDFYLFNKTLDDGITINDDGQYIIRVAPEDTRDAEAGKYFYDLQIIAGSDVFTVMHGVLELDQDVVY